MSTLIYSAILSLDGFTADEAGSFAWAAPDEEVHAFINELERPVTPVVVGGGTPALPRSVHANLQLRGERRFPSGVVYLDYEPRK